MAKKTHNADRIIKYQLLPGVKCPGCGSPVLRSETHYWCAVSPGGCVAKNLKWRISDDKKKSENSLK